MQVVLMLISTRAGDEEIVDVSVRKCETPKNLVYETLECLRSVAKTKWHLQKFEKSKRGCYGRLGNIGWLHRDLMIGSHQIYFGKNCGSLNGGCKVLDMWDWISVGLGDIGVRVPHGHQSLDFLATKWSGDDQLDKG